MSQYRSVIGHAMEGNGPWQIRGRSYSLSMKEIAHPRGAHAQKTPENQPIGNPCRRYRVQPPQSKREQSKSNNGPMARKPSAEHPQQIEGIAEKIVRHGGDYVLALNGNQGTMYREVVEFFEDAFALLSVEDYLSENIGI